MFIFPLGFRCWCSPWRIVFWLSLEAVNEICKMEEVGHGLYSGFGFITKWSNRKVNAYWNLRASFVDTDTVTRRSLTGHWLSISMIGFHENRDYDDDDDISTWISSQIEVRVAFDFSPHYADVKLISVYLSLKNLLFNRDHLFNDLVNSRKNTLEITLKPGTFYNLLQLKRPHLEISYKREKTSPDCWNDPLVEICCLFVDTNKCEWAIWTTRSPEAQNMSHCIKTDAL